MTINPDDLDGPDAVAHWRQRHDHVKARSNAQYEELEAVRWERDQFKAEAEKLQLHVARLQEKIESDRARMAELEADIADAYDFCSELP